MPSEYPNLSRLYDVSPEGQLSPKPADSESKGPGSWAPPALRNRMGYIAGDAVRNLFSPTGGASKAFNHPVTGGIALGAPAAAGGFGLAKVWNYLSPSMPGILGQLGQVSPQIAALITGLIGTTAGGYLGHTRRGYLKSAAMDPLQEIMMAVQMADLPPDVKFRAIQVLPTKSPGEISSIARILGATSGAAAGAVLMRLLFGAGGLGMLGGGVAGGMLGSRAATLFG